MQSIINNLPKLAKDKYKENKVFLAKLRKKPPKQLDYIMQDLHHKEFERTDCLKCANCCKTTGPLFTDKDISRISKHFKMKEREFISAYLSLDEDNDYVLQSVPCTFLDADNYCSIYDVRPKACREFPHTDRKKFQQISHLTLKNVAICPAAFNIVEAMKKQILVILFIVFCASSFAQTTEWMQSLSIAKRAARQQNKMILMVWEEATYYPFPVRLKGENGKYFFYEDLFSTPELTDVLWDYFVPLKVSELFYEDFFKTIKGKRRLTYISKFNDDSIKVMDANGTILATSGTTTELLDLSKLISKYALNTSFLKQQLKNYAINKNFYSAFYLAEKYTDYSVLVPKKIRSDILQVSNIYFSEAKFFLDNDNELKHKKSLQQRIELIKLKQDLIKNSPRKVLRQLKKISTQTIEKQNKALVSFLYYTAYRLLNNKDEFSKKENEISLVNLKQAQAIVNINR